MQIVSDYDRRGGAIAETKSFMGACRDFFGVKENQKALEFGKEVQALTGNDKVEIAIGLTTLGYVIQPWPVADQSWSAI